MGFLICMKRIAAARGRPPLNVASQANVEGGMRRAKRRRLTMNLLYREKPQAVIVSGRRHVG